jgi:hypothetical protein
MDTSVHNVTNYEYVAKGLWEKFEKAFQSQILIRSGDNTTNCNYVECQYAEWQFWLQLTVILNYAGTCGSATLAVVHCGTTRRTGTTRNTGKCYGGNRKHSIGHCRHCSMKYSTISSVYILLTWWCDYVIIHELSFGNVAIWRNEFRCNEFGIMASGVIAICRIVHTPLILRLSDHWSLMFRLAIFFVFNNRL